LIVKFVLLTFLALVFSLAGGALIIVQIDPPHFLISPGERLGILDQHLLVLAGATIVPSLLIVWAYVSSFRRPPRRAARGRPVIGLYVIGFSAVWVAMAWSITALMPTEEFLTMPTLAIAAGLLVVLPFTIRTVEVLTGAACGNVGSALLRIAPRRGLGLAARFLGVARLFLPTRGEVVREYGLALYGKGRSDRAGAVLAEAYQAGDRDPQLVQALGELATGLDGELACRVLTNILETDPTNARAGRRLVELHVRLQRPAQALSVLERFYNSDNLEDVCLLGRLNAEQGNVERALELAKRAVELEGPPYRRTLADLQVLAMQAPDNPAILLTLADLNERIKDRDEAVSWYLSLLEKEPENSGARRRLIRLYRELARLDQAMLHYRALLRYETESASAVETALEYGQVLLDRQDFDKALKVFQEFVARYPQEWRLSYHCAQALFSMGRLAEAAEVVERARTECASAEPAEHPGRSQIQILASRIQAAIITQELTALREQAHGEGASIDDRLAYVERLVACQRSEGAARELDLMLEQMPANKGRIVRFLEQIVERGEQRFVLLNFLADICLRDRNFDRCYQLYATMARQSLHPDEVLADGCRQIVRANPDHLPSLTTQATLFTKGGHWGEAAAVLGRILQLSPSVRDDLVPTLFDVYYHLGDCEHAIPYGQELLARDSGNLSVYLRLRELFTKREDHNAAIAILKRALEVAPDNRQIKEMIEESEKLLRQQRLAALLKQLEASPKQPELLREAADLHLILGHINDAITAYQHATLHAEGNLRSLCQIKLAHCLAGKTMFDLADETVREIEIREKDPQYLDEIKHHLYEVARLFEQDEQWERTLQIYKKLFKIDAGYKDVVQKIEWLSYLGR